MFTLEQFIANERTPDGQPQQYITNEVIGDSVHFDPGLLRPYRDDRGRVWVDVTVAHEQVKDKDGSVVRNSKGEPRVQPVYDPQLVYDRMRRDLPVLQVTSNATVLRKDQWIQLDTVVSQAARKRLRLWADMRAANTFGVDGMATPILEYERLSDAGEAMADMDGLSEGRNFAPTFNLQGMPLPITHCDFWISSRFLASSRRGGGRGADTIRAEMAGRRVGELIEMTAIGTVTGTVYGTSTDYAQTSQVYGLTNHPDRITETGITAPTGSNGTTILTEWLNMREDLYAQNFYGPFVVYTATSYDQYLDNLFSTTEPSAGTLRENLLKIEGVSAIRRLDYLTTANTLVWAQLGDEIQAVNGMEVTTVQWETKGGMQLNFKVMGIQVPRIRAVQVNTGTTGPATAATAKAPILHATS